MLPLNALFTFVIANIRGKYQKTNFFALFLKKVLYLHQKAEGKPIKFNQ